MNPLGQLPASTSPQFSLSKVDWIKILRYLVILGASLFVTEVSPYLGHFTYVYHGHDYTTDVLWAVAGLAEMARRFLSGQPKD